MTWSATAVALLVAAGHSAPAHADDADALVAEGQELAKRGQIGDAIAKFREADRIAPRAIHSCLIGLAYLRGGSLPDAELMFANCHAHAIETLPPWVKVEEDALAARIAAADLGMVTLTLDPAIVELSVPALLAGTRFPARKTLHLPPGPHRIVGHTADRRQIIGEVTSVVGQPRDVTLGVTAPLSIGGAAPIVEEPASSSRTPAYLMVAGGAVLVVGGLVHVLAVRPAREDLAAAQTGADYDDLHGPYALRRNVTLGLYAVGGVALITGFVLARRAPEGPRITAQLGDGGAAVAVEWSR